jgi:hypothetical protein
MFFDISVIKYLYAKYTFCHNAKICEVSVFIKASVFILKRRKEVPRMVGMTALKASPLCLLLYSPPAPLGHVNELKAFDASEGYRVALKESIYSTNQATSYLLQVYLQRERPVYV